LNFKEIIILNVQLEKQHIPDFVKDNESCRDGMIEALVSAPIADRTADRAQIQICIQQVMRNKYRQAADSAAWPDTGFTKGADRKSRAHPY
jgi:hypothetical protein